MATKAGWHRNYVTVILCISTRPVAPVVDELAGEVACVEEAEAGVVDVVRVAHRQTAQEVADQDETVGD